MDVADGIRFAVGFWAGSSLFIAAPIATYLIVVLIVSLLRR